MKTLIRAAVLGSLLAGASACENKTTMAEPPARVEVVSGNDQRAMVGQELSQPLVVKVVDEDGRPVRDQLVNFRVTRGGGSVFAGSAITNHDGIARERWRLGTAADSQRVEARAVDTETGAAIVFATFHAMATAAGAAGVSAVNPQLSGPPATPLADFASALVRDRYGNPVPGVTVNWAVTSGGGSVSPANSTTDAQGIARTQWTLGQRVGTAQTLRASAGAGMGVTFTATVAIGAGATISAVSGSGQTSPATFEFAQPLVVLVKQNGVPVQGAQVQWTTSGGMFPDASVATTTTTDEQGHTSVRWRAGFRVGAQTAIARVHDATVTFTGTATTGTPSWLLPMSVPATVTPGTTLQGRFRVTDNYGNPVAGEPVELTTTYGTVTPATGVSDPDGWVDVTWSFPRGLNGAESVLATIRGLVTVTADSGTAHTTVRPVVAKVVAYPEARTVAPGEITEFSAYFEDEFGNRFSVRGHPWCGVWWSGPAAVELNPLLGLQYPNVNASSNTPGIYTITANACNGISDTATLTVQ